MENERKTYPNRKTKKNPKKKQKKIPKKIRTPNKLCDDLTWSFGHVPINDEEGKYHIAHCKLRWNLARLNWRRH